MKEGKKFKVEEEKGKVKDVTREVYDSLYRERLRKERIRNLFIILGIGVISLVFVLVIYFFVLVPYLDKLSKEPKKFDVVVSLVYGNVKVSNSILGSSEDVKVGYRLKEGDVITTFRDSECELKVSDSTVIRVLQDTVISFSEVIMGGMGKVREVNIGSGTAISLFKAKRKNEYFNIKTDTGFATVRGTHFYVSSDGKRSKLVVSDGKVSMLARLKNLEEVMGMVKDENLRSEIFEMQVNSSIIVEGGKKAEVTGEMARKAQELIQDDVEIIKNLLVRGESLNESVLLGLQKRISEVREKINLRSYDASPEELGLFRRYSKFEVKDISVGVKTGIETRVGFLFSSDHLLTFSKNGVVYLSKKGIFELPLKNVLSAVALGSDIAVLVEDSKGAFSIKVFSTYSTNLKKEISLKRLPNDIKVVGNIAWDGNNVVIPTTRGVLIVDLVSGEMIIVNVGRVSSGILFFYDSLMLVNDDGEVYKVRIDKIGDIYSISPGDVIVKLSDVEVKGNIYFVADKGGSIYVASKGKLYKIFGSKQIFAIDVPELYFSPILLDTELLVVSKNRAIGIDKENGRELYTIEFEGNVVGYPYVKESYFAVITDRGTYVYDLRTKTRLSKYDFVGVASYVDDDKLYIVGKDKVFVVPIH